MSLRSKCSTKGKKTNKQKAGKMFDPHEYVECRKNIPY